MRNFFDFNDNYFVSDTLVGQCNAVSLGSVYFNGFEYLYSDNYEKNRCYY